MLSTNEPSTDKGSKALPVRSEAPEPSPGPGAARTHSTGSAPAPQEVTPSTSPVIRHSDIDRFLTGCRIAACSQAPDPTQLSDPSWEPIPWPLAAEEHLRSTRGKPWVTFLDGFHGHGAVLELLQFKPIRDLLAVRLVPRGGFDKCPDARQTWSQRSGLRSYGGDAKDVFDAEALPATTAVFSGAMCVDNSGARQLAAMEHLRVPPPERDPLGGQNAYYFMQAEAYVRRDIGMCIYEYLPSVLFNGDGVGQIRMLAPHRRRGDLIVQWILDECTLGVDTPKGGHETRLFTVCVRPDIVARCGSHLEHPQTHCQPEILTDSLDWRLDDDQVPDDLWVEFVSFDSQARPSIEARHAPTCVGAGTNASGDRTFVYLLSDVLRCPTIRGEPAYGGTGVYQTRSGRFRRLTHRETTHVVHSYPRLSHFATRTAIVNAWAARQAFAVAKSVTDYLEPLAIESPPDGDTRAAVVAYLKARTSWPVQRAFQHLRGARLGSIRFGPVLRNGPRPLTVLVAITVGPRPRVLTTSARGLPRFVEQSKSKRKDRVEIAEHETKEAFGFQAICGLAGEFRAPGGHDKRAQVRVVTYATASPPSPPTGAKWIPADDPDFGPAEQACIASAARWMAIMAPQGPQPSALSSPIPRSANTTRDQEHVLRDDSLACLGTRIPARITAPEEPAEAATRDLARAVEASNGAARELRERLRKEPDLPGDDGFMASWADSVANDLQVETLPPAARSSVVFDLDRACSAPFPKDYVAAVTAAPEAPEAPTPTDRPASVQELLGDRVITRLRAWLKSFAADMKRMIRGQERQFSTPFVVAQDQLPERFRGVVWDLRAHLRSRGKDPITPLDPTRPLESHLNLKLLDDLLESYPDQELRVHLTKGISSKTDLPLQTVLFPHLTSLPAGADKVEKEILKFEAKHGWYEFFACLPFVPFRTMPQGTAPRKGEDRPRRTSDGGAPRKTLVDGRGQEVPSYNDAIGIRNVIADGDPPIYKWAREVKPTVADKAQAAHILCGAGALLGEPVLAMTDDVASFFNQLLLCAKDLWKQGHLWTALREGQFGPFEGSEVTFVAEYCLGFGLAHSSNIAQRFAHALVHVIQSRFDREEENLGIDPRWTRKRQHLEGSTQNRLYHISMYTDDKMSIVVGVDRFVRLLRHWRGLTLPLNMLMAGPSKRGAGPVVDWLGLKFFVSLNALVIPTCKLARALATLEAAISGRSVTHAEYRQLCGLLVHLHPWVAMREDALYGLWKCLKFDYGPAVPIIRGRVKTDLLEEWKERLSSQGGVPFQAAFGQRPVDVSERQTATFAITCDAAKQGARIPGIAGFMAGLFWVITLRREDVEGPLEIPIVLLEFVGIVVSLIVFERIVGQASVVLYTDSDTSASILRNRAHSPLTQAAHRALLKSPEFRRLRRNGLSIGHLYGEGNVFADLASRGQVTRFRALCHQMGVRTTEVPVPQRAREFLDTVRAERFELAREQGQVTGPAPPDRFTRAFVSRDANAIANASKQSSNVAADGPKIILLPTRRSVTPSGATRIVAPAPGPPKRRRYERTPPEPPVWRQTTIDQFAEAQSARGIPAAPPRRDRRPRPRTIVSGTPREILGPRARVDSDHENHDTRRHEPMTYIRRLSVGRPPGLVPADAPLTSLPQLSRGHHYEIRHADSSWFSDLRSAAHYHISTTRSKNTRRSDRRNWPRWVSYCRRAGAVPERTNVDANRGIDLEKHEEEVDLAVGFILDEWARMKPRSYKERPRALPESALQVWLSVKREHRARHKIPMVESRAIPDLIKSLEKHYGEVYGSEFLLPHRKEQMTDRILKGLLSLPEGTPLAPGVTVSRTCPLTATFEALWTTLAATGFRKDEVSLETEETPFPKTKMSRAHLRWRVAGTDRQTLTEQQLGQLRVGDMAIIIPATAKNDQTGVAFGNSPIYLHVDPRDPLCPATRLARMERLHPILDLEERRATPLFSLPSRKPLYHSLVESALDTALATFLSKTERQNLSNHSFRIGLACALMAAGEPAHVVKAICRWRSDASVVLYARISPDEYLRRLQRARAGYRMTASCVAVNLPRGHIGGV